LKDDARPLEPDVDPQGHGVVWPAVGVWNAENVVAGKLSGQNQRRGAYFSPELEAGCDDAVD